DPAAESGDDIQQSSAGGVHAQRIKDEVGVREEQRGAKKESGGRKITGNGGLNGLELLLSGDTQLIALTVQDCAECLERVLGVVASADGLAEAGGAVGLKSSKEDGGLDLRRG